MVSTFAPKKPFLHNTESSTPGYARNNCFGYVNALVQWLMTSPQQLQDTSKGVTLKGSYTLRGGKSSEHDQGDLEPSCRRAKLQRNA